MLDNIRKIVCINLGTRYVGLATFQDQNLRDWRVKTFNGKWSESKEKKILEALSGYLDDYLPDLVIFKDHDPVRSSPALDWLRESAITLVKTRGLLVKKYSLLALKSLLPKGSRKNREMLAEEVAKRWPAIGLELQKERKNRNSYHQKMFEAVALGSNCLQK